MLAARGPSRRGLWRRGIDTGGPYTQVLLVSNTSSCCSIDEWRNSRPMFWNRTLYVDGAWCNNKYLCSSTIPMHMDPFCVRGCLAFVSQCQLPHLGIARTVVGRESPCESLHVFISRPFVLSFTRNEFLVEMHAENHRPKPTLSTPRPRWRASGRKITTASFPFYIIISTPAQPSPEIVLLRPSSSP